MIGLGDRFDFRTFIYSDSDFQDLLRREREGGKRRGGKGAGREGKLKGLGREGVAGGEENGAHI